MVEKSIKYMYNIKLYNYIILNLILNKCILTMY